MTIEYTGGFLTDTETVSGDFTSTSGDVPDNHEKWPGTQTPTEKPAWENATPGVETPGPSESADEKKTPGNETDTESSGATTTASAMKTTAETSEQNSTTENETDTKVANASTRETVPDTTESTASS